MEPGVGCTSPRIQRQDPETGPRDRAAHSGVQTAVRELGRPVNMMPRQSQSLVLQCFFYSESFGCSLVEDTMNTSSWFHSKRGRKREIKILDIYELTFSFMFPIHTPVLLLESFIQKPIHSVTHHVQYKNNVPLSCLFENVIWSFFI